LTHFDHISPSSTLHPIVVVSVQYTEQNKTEFVLQLHCYKFSWHYIHIYTSIYIVDDKTGQLNIYTFTMGELW